MSSLAEFFLDVLLNGLLFRDRGWVLLGLTCVSVILIIVVAVHFFR